MKVQYWLIILFKNNKFKFGHQHKKERGSYAYFQRSGFKNLTYISKTR